MSLANDSIVLRKPPSLRNNNGVIQPRVRIEGVDFFINRLGNNNPVSIAKAQTLSAQIWQDYCSRCLDYTNKYQPVQDDAADDILVDALEQHYWQQVRVVFATLRLVLAYKDLWGRSTRSLSSSSG